MPIFESLPEQRKEPALLYCFSCKQQKPLSAFIRDRSKKGGLKRPCRQCIRTTVDVLKRKNRQVRLTDIAASKPKVCSKCGIEKPITAFPPNAMCEGGTLSWCRLCEKVRHKEWRTAKAEHVRKRGRQEQAKLYAANPEKYRAILRRSRLKTKYGLTEAAFEDMLKAQRGLCSICLCSFGHAKPNRNIHVDHDHLTGAVRALLCSGCNTGIGMFRDNTEFLERAINYLKRHRKQT